VTNEPQKPDDSSGRGQRATRAKTVKRKTKAAEAILKAKEAERAEAEKMQRDQLNKENLFYIRCRYHKDHHGIYLTEYPSGAFHPGQWFSIEHSLGDDWFEPMIRCQECLSGGDRYSNLQVRPQRMADGNQAFTIPSTINGAEMVFSISRDSLERRMGAKIEEFLGEGVTS